VVEHVRAQPAYDAPFAAAFPGRGVSMDTVGEALAAYEATLLDGNTRFDRWYYGGESGALTPQEQQGFSLFSGKAGCSQCHLIGPRDALFSDGKWHNTGIGYARTMAAAGPQSVELVPGLRTSLPRAQMAAISAPQANDLGRFEVTLNPADRWAYMTPALRAISRTAPYMHDGSLTSLPGVVEFYDKGGIGNPEKSALVRPLGLSEAEKAALLVFLQAL
jgi:cytochrome c peroxidase